MLLLSRSIHVCDFTALLQPVGVEVKDIGAAGFGFDSGLMKSTYCGPRLTAAAMFLRSCVVQALSREDLIFRFKLL